MIYGKVYKISNDINSKLYIGQTTRTIEERFKAHAKADSVIGKAIRKYGAEHFHVETIEKCYTREELNEAEIKWIKCLNTQVPNGYNVTEGGLGHKGEFSEEHRANLSKAGMGNKRSLGRKHTEDEKRRIRESNLGKKRSAETRERVRQAKLGLKASDETKAKMSAVRKGRKFTEDHKHKISEARKNYWARVKAENGAITLTEEHRRKISDGLNAHYSKVQSKNDNQPTLFDNI